MKTCIGCKKSGLLLRLDANGRCKACASAFENKEYERKRAEEIARKNAEEAGRLAAEIQKRKMDLRDKIKELCKEKQISMNTLETTLGFGKGYISKLGKSTPNASKIQQIADYFGVSIDYLMTGEDKEDNRYYLNDETAEMAQTLFENKKLRVLFDAAKDATPEDLETTYNMLMALKKKERGNNVD